MRTAEAVTVTVLAPDDSVGVRVVAAPALVAELVPLCQPWLRVVAGPDDRAAFTVIAGAEYATDRPRLPVVYEPDDEPPRRLQISRSARELVIEADADPWRLQQVLRAVRNLLRWQLFSPGRLFLHGGLVTFEGRGVAYVGAKRSGKTSSIMAALGAGATFIVNDDLMVTGLDGAPVGFGWPRTVAVRRDSLVALRAQLPALWEACHDLAHPANRWNVAKDDSPRSLHRLLWVQPRELVRATGSGVAASAPLHALVLPAFDDSVRRPRLEPLDEEAARSLLLAHVERTAVKYDDFMRDWFPPVDDDEIRAMVRRLVATVPVYGLRQSMSTLADAATVVRDELLRPTAVAMPGAGAA